MASRNGNLKKESVSSEAFLALGPDAKALVCSKALLHPNPRFAWELARSEPTGFAFKTHRTSSYSDIEPLALTALHGGKLALARIMFGRSRLSSEPKSKTWDDRGNFARINEHDALSKLYSGSADDEQAWRARAWIQTALRTHAKPSARLLEQEASLALALGRPSIGLKLLAELACHPRSEISACRERKDPYDHPSIDDPASELSSTRVDFKASSSANACHASAWSSALEAVKVKDGRQERKLGRKDLLGKPALALANLWSDILRESKKPELIELGSKISAASDALWSLGAPTSPQDYAKRFRSSPLESDAAQIKEIAKLGGFAQAQRLLPAWKMAAANPKSPCGPKILWDAFIDAHSGLEAGIQANPFALCAPGQTAAMWSLAGGSDLIELGIERGFDPKPHSRLLAKPGASGTAASERASLAPRFHQYSYGAPATQTCACDGLHCAAPMRGAAPKSGSVHPKSKWLHTNLASVALASGADGAAVALTRAGCEAADPFLALNELRESRSLPKQDIDDMQARWEAISLRASLDAPSPPKAKGRSKKAEQAAREPEPIPAKRRIIKV